MNTMNNRRSGILLGTVLLTIFAISGFAQVKSTGISRKAVFGLILCWRGTTNPPMSILMKSGRSHNGADPVIIYLTLLILGNTASLSVMILPGI